MEQLIPIGSQLGRVALVCLVLLLGSTACETRAVLEAGAPTILPSSPEESSERTTNPAATGVILGAGGLGIVEFGAEPNDVIDQLTQEFGPPDQDTGYTPAFSVFGTCPGEKVRGVRWGSLLVLFSDGETGFASEGTFHFFSYRDQLFDIDGRPVESLGLSTAEGVGLGSTVKDLRAAYGDDLTIRRRSLPGRIDRFFFETDGRSLGGTLARRTNSVAAFLGGAGCGE